jgi:CRP/FNR family cyclic AMP-dependent transcriptional regulator
MRKVLYIFGVLNDTDVDWMVRTGIRRQISGGDILIEEGNVIDSVALLLSGRMTVSVDGVGEVAQLASGDLIGEMSLVDSAPPSATVAAKTDCTALMLDKRALRRKLGEDIGFASRFYHALAIVLSDRLRATERHLGPSQDHGLEDESARLKDELDIGVLDQVSMAGDRFDRLLKSVEGRT